MIYLNDIYNKTIDENIVIRAIKTNDFTIEVLMEDLSAKVFKYDDKYLCHEDLSVINKKANVQILHG